MLKVVIVEDNELVRTSIHEILSENPAFGLIRSYASCEEALRELDAPLPDAVLMDLQLPGMDGIEGIYKIKKLYPQVEILVVTINHDHESVFNALCAGASGYIHKNADLNQISKAIQDICNGGAPMSSQIARMVVESFQRNNESPLSKRETQVLQLMSVGKTTPTIAKELSVGKETVRTHTKNIYHKLQTKTKEETIEKARKYRLI